MQLDAALPAAELERFEAERELIERAKRDRGAFAALYRRHHPRIAGYIYRRVGDAHLAEDLAADVFLAALQTLPKYLYSGAPLSAWLYRIATNRVNRWARRERSRAMQRLDETTVTPQPAGNGEPHGAVLTRDYVRTALLTLAPRHQAVLALHYLEGLPIEDVAAALGCRLGTVKSRLSRARALLRRRLERSDRFEPDNCPPKGGAGFQPAGRQDACSTPSERRT